MPRHDTQDCAHDGVGWLGSWCPQCGPDVTTDEDECCASCGADALGDGADAAIRQRSKLANVVAIMRAYKAEQDEPCEGHLPPRRVLAMIEEALGEALSG